MNLIHLAFNFDKFQNVNFLIDFICGTLLLIVLIFLVVKNLKRKFVYIFYVVAGLILVTARIFDLEFVIQVMSIGLAVATVVFLFVNIAEIRHYLANPLKSKSVKNNVLNLLKNGNGKEESTYNIATLYKSINDAVVSLSKTKTGALMTFQKKVPLTDTIKSGSIINAPVTAELIQTIFYPGTRLHDGAIVIKDNIIIAASVYYTPTTKPLTGKYGARHRAGLGISEITDSVTVIVSEETGRVSIAYNGELEAVTLDNFLRVFEDYMMDVKGK